MTASITIQINGENREIIEGASLLALIELLGIKTDRVAVELNGAIVPRGRWKETVLHSGDRLEMVHFVGGGASCFPH